MSPWLAVSQLVGAMVFLFRPTRANTLVLASIHYYYYFYFYLYFFQPHVCAPSVIKVHRKFNLSLLVAIN